MQEKGAAIDLSLNESSKRLKSAKFIPGNDMATWLEDFDSACDRVISEQGEPDLRCSSKSPWKYARRPFGYVNGNHFVVLKVETRSAGTQS